MKLHIILLIAALACTSCRVQQDGIAVLMDESYVIQVIAASDDGFAAPDGIVWRNHRIALADEGGHAVVARSAQHSFNRLADTSAGIQSPEDLVIDTDGTIFFTDDDAGGLWQITPAGEVSQLAGKNRGLVSTEGLVLAPSGNLLVGDGSAHAIFEVTREGEVSVFLGPESGISKPESLAFDEHGDLYIADNGQNVIFRFSRERQLQKLITAKDGLTHPESICYRAGALYITDDEAGKLYRYTALDGLRTLAVFGGRLRHLQGITAGPDESLLMTVQDLKHKRGLVLQVTRITGLNSYQVATAGAGDQ